MMQKIAQWYRTLPRSGRWLVIAGLVLLGYFPIDWALGVANSINASADRYASLIRRNNSGVSDQKLQMATMTQAVQTFGVVNEPTDAKTAGDAITKRVNAVLKANRIKDFKIRDRMLSLPNNGPLAATLAPGESIDRMIKDVEFDASPDTLVAILSQLEQSPEVAAVSQVRLGKATGGGSRGSSAPRVLTVSLSIETWVKGRKAGRA